MTYKILKSSFIKTAGYFRKTTSSLSCVLAFATAISLLVPSVQAQETFPNQIHVAAGEHASGRILNVGIGRSVVINLAEDAADVLVSNPEIADAVLRTPRRIFVLGNTAGQSRLVLFGRSGRELASFDIRVEKDTSDITRIIRKLIPGTNISAESVNGNVILSGTAKSTLEAQQAADIAAKFQGADLSSSIVNLIAVSGKDQVHLKVTVAEVERSVVKQLGVRFAGSVTAGNFRPFGDLVPNFNVNPSIVNQATAGFTFINSTGSFTAQLDALQRDGVIRTLAEPTLTAISGENASFLAGGEFPIPISQEDNKISVEFKKFGVGLDFTPVVLSEGRISLRVKTEVSELSNEGAVSAGGITISALKVRRAEIHHGAALRRNLGDGRSFEGILSASYRGCPWTDANTGFGCAVQKPRFSEKSDRVGCLCYALRRQSGRSAEVDTPGQKSVRCL